MAITITVTIGEDSKTLTIANDKQTDFLAGFEKAVNKQEEDVTLDLLAKLVKDTVFAYYATGKEQTAVEAVDAGVDSAVVSEES
jgi:hypothetical protein